MPKSAAFIRIRNDVLAIVRAIPAGKLATCKAIGAHLDVMPRHVANILRMLSPQDTAVIPWHRVVSDTGPLARIFHEYEVGGLVLSRVIRGDRSLQTTEDRRCQSVRKTRSTSAAWVVASSRRTSAAET
jgi:alkylated DNA nucleotide flippase Atl1